MWGGTSLTVALSTWPQLCAASFRFPPALKWQIPSMRALPWTTRRPWAVLRTRVPGLLAAHTYTPECCTPTSEIIRFPVPSTWIPSTPMGRPSAREIKRKSSSEADEEKGEILWREAGVCQGWCRVSDEVKDSQHLRWWIVCFSRSRINQACICAAGRRAVGLYRRVIRLPDVSCSNLRSLMRASLL